MAAFFRNILVSLQLILVMTVLSLVYGFVVRGGFTFAYVFNGNFIAGAFVICVALIRLILPARFKFDKLTDHTTFGERYYAEQHREKQKKAHEFLFLGITMIVITGLLQLILSLIIPAN